MLSFIFINDESLGRLKCLTIKVKRKICIVHSKLISNEKKNE